MPLRALGSLACVLALAAPAGAQGLLDGLSDSVKQLGDAVKDAGDAVDDVKQSKEEISGTIDESKQLLPDREWKAAPGGQITTLSGKQLGERIASGAIDRDTLVWTKGMKDWKPAVEVGALAGHFEDAPPPLPDVATEDDGPPPLPGQ